MIHLGFEIKTGESVALPLHHLVATGATRLSGKTTTLWALTSRLPEGYSSIAFRTKRGELDFSAAHLVIPFFREQTDWEYVQSLLEASMKERLKFERSWIIKACHGAQRLQDVYENINRSLRATRSGLEESVYTNLKAYFEKVLPELSGHPFASSLELVLGPNVMDLGHLTEEVQSLVISSCLEHIWKHGRNTIVIIPEAWKFIPQTRGGPVKWAAQHVIREGGVVGVYLWLDSQDISNVDKSVLKSVDVWLLGRQREFNEVRHTLAQMPVVTDRKPKPEEVMTLKVGHFYAMAESWCKLVYVQPAWMDEGIARRVATGEIATVPQPLPSIFKEEGEEAVWKEKVAELEQTLARANERVKMLEEDREAWVKQHKEMQARYEAMEKSVNDAFAPFISLISAKLQSHNSSEPLEVEDIVARVLSRIPGNHTGSMTPPEALRTKLQEQTLARIGADIEALPEDAKLVLKHYEAIGRYMPYKEAVATLGFDYDENKLKWNTAKQPLHKLNLLDSNSNGFRSLLYQKIWKSMEPYGGTESEAQVVYQNMLYILAESKV